MNPLPSGVYAALLTPVDGRGQLDLEALARLVEFVAERGVRGVVVGGATGEYPSFSVEEREGLIRHVTDSAKGRMPVVAGTGCTTLTDTVRLGRVAAETGCHSVLLAMPYFFRYQPEDLVAFSRTVSQASSLPCLLYHLPAFTNALTPDDLARVLESEPRIAGVKDSSGVRANLARLAEVRRRRAFSLFAGDDALALDALRAGWDGIISGIACFLPELMVRLEGSFRVSDGETAALCQADISRVIKEIVKLPVPWAIRIGLEVRGISPGPLPLPVSAERQSQIAAYREWLGGWLPTRSWYVPLPGA
jgi:4-hydroxy-tetrahydrodipicolinate synthase